MWLNILIGCCLIVITIIIHATATRFVMDLSMKQLRPGGKKRKHFNVYWISVIVLLMFFASIIEAVFWAGSYVALNAIETMDRALYFSIVTFTTLGYGDITLNESWRLLASFEAANGIIMFGWTTAIIMAVVQKLYFKKQ